MNSIQQVGGPRTRRVKATLALGASLLSSFAGMPRASAECIGNYVLSAETLSSILKDTMCTAPDTRPGHLSTTCETDDQGQFICEPTVPIESQGTAYSKYLVLTVVYSPPGSNDCAQAGEITYMDTSTVGTSLSVTSAESSTIEVKASGGIDSPVIKNMIEGSKTNSIDTGSSNEVNITSTSTMDRTVTGPCTNGVDHKRDMIYLVVDPLFYLVTAESAGCVECGADKLTWTLGGGRLMPVRVGELLMSAGTIEGYAGADPNVVAKLDATSLTWLEKLVIASADPFFQADDTQQITPDPTRFSLATQVPYRVNDGNGTVSGTADTMDNRTHKTGYDAAFTYVTMTKFEGGISFFNIVNAAFGGSEKLTLKSTNKSTNDSTTATAAKITRAAAPVGEWNGPIGYNVYYDTIFHTYAFLPQ